MILEVFAGEKQTVNHTRWYLADKLEEDGLLADALIEFERVESHVINSVYEDSPEDKGWFIGKMADLYEKCGHDEKAVKYRARASRFHALGDAKQQVYLDKQKAKERAEHLEAFEQEQRRRAETPQQRLKRVWDSCCIIAGAEGPTALAELIALQNGGAL